MDDAVSALAARRRRAILELAGFGPSQATFALHRGEVLGIAGLVGAGRTRLLRTLFGLEPVRSGTRSSSAPSPARARRGSRWQHGMGMLSEDRKGEGLAPGCRSPTT